MKNIVDIINESKNVKFSGSSRCFSLDVNEAFLLTNVLQMFKESEQYKKLHKDFQVIISDFIEDFAEYVDERKDEFEKSNAEYIEMLKDFNETGKTSTGSYERGRRIDTDPVTKQEVDFDELLLNTNAKNAAWRLEKWIAYNKNIAKVFAK